MRQFEIEIFQVLQMLRLKLPLMSEYGVLKRTDMTRFNRYLLDKLLKAESGNINLQSVEFNFIFKTNYSSVLLTCNSVL